MNDTMLAQVLSASESGLPTFAEMRALFGQLRIALESLQGAEQS